MTIVLADYVNESPPSARLGSLLTFVDSCRNTENPIDIYRSSMATLLSYGTQDALRDSDFLGRLLVLGVVSAAEGYIRGVLSSILEVCPIAQSKAAENSVNLGGILWHGKEGFARSAFEHTTFLAKDEIQKAFLKYIGYKLEDRVFSNSLDQFELVCQLRHGIVHSDGYLPGRNAIKLGIPKSNDRTRIIIRFAQLQDIASVINTLVFTINRELFVELSQRWAIQWRTRSDWNIEQEEKIYRRIWNNFHSKDEIRSRSGRSHITFQKCFREARKLYGL